MIAFQAELTTYAHIRRERVVLKERDSVLCWHNCKQRSVAGTQVSERVVVGCGGREAAEVCGGSELCKGFLRGSRVMAGIW